MTSTKDHKAWSMNSKKAILLCIDFCGGYPTSHWYVHKVVNQLILISHESTVVIEH